MSTNILIRDRDRENEDSVLYILNLFAIILNSADYQPASELEQTKILLEQAFLDYENLRKILQSKNINNDVYFDNPSINETVEKIYEELIDKKRDNF